MAAGATPLLRYPEPLTSSSSAFDAPVHPVKPVKQLIASKPSDASVLPILLPAPTLRPLAFRTFTKKHDLTLTSSALQNFATFIGKHCGSGWREEGLAENVLDVAAKTWKKNGGSVIVPGDNEELATLLQALAKCMVGGRVVDQRSLTRQSSLTFGEGPQGNPTTSEQYAPDEGQSSRETTTNSVKENGYGPHKDEPRVWLKVISAFEQPRLFYNAAKKHFEIMNTRPSLIPDPSHKTQIFRNRYHLIHQRLLRNDAFQASIIAASHSRQMQDLSSARLISQKAYKITQISNLLGRNGSSHVLLGMLTMSPTSTLTLSDLTGSIVVDIQYARPVPEDGVWFTPGMIVLVEGMYEEQASVVGSGLGEDRGIGGSIGGRFLAFSVGGPPSERRDATLGLVDTGRDGFVNSAGGFGWVDFLGVGSERSAGPEMRKLEQQLLFQYKTSNAESKSSIIIMGEVNLDSEKNLQALRKVLSLYAAEPAERVPTAFVLMGNFVQHAVLAGGGSGGSIDYKEYFDSLAAVLSEFPSILQIATFIFVPGDNDPWASAFSAGAATILPRRGLPEVLTTRVKRAFALANAETEKSSGKKALGEAIWSTNPSRLALFGPVQEIVLFRDNISGRLRRNALRFANLEPETEANQTVKSSRASEGEEATEKKRVEGDLVQEIAEATMPGSKAKASAVTGTTFDSRMARKLVKTVLDQGHLSPFPLSMRPVLWDYGSSLNLYPLPTAIVLMDPESPSFAITYEGCHAMNPGCLVSQGKRGSAQWIEFDVQTKRGKLREARF
ncbi:MAG: hypothetical protein LQ351_000802 [Letrouitia transgressa]|nr:MAG: hypothetical protein LQ351_000802 [Letrouitia transgressa]